MNTGVKGEDEIISMGEQREKPVDASHNQEEHARLAVDSESHPDPMHPRKQLKKQQQEIGDPQQQNDAHGQKPPLRLTGQKG
jgi:hypothetical protein